MTDAILGMFGASVVDVGCFQMPLSSLYISDESKCQSSQSEEVKRERCGMLLKKQKSLLE